MARRITAVLTERIPAFAFGTRRELTTRISERKTHARLRIIEMGRALKNTSCDRHAPKSVWLSGCSIFEI